MTDFNARRPSTWRPSTWRPSTWQSSARRTHNSSAKYENIDRQISAIHTAMAHKLIAQPELRLQVIQTIENRYANGQLRHGGYLMWICLMENIDDHQGFLDAVLADTPQMKKLRRRTPFINVLSEQERLEALSTAGES